MRKIDKNPYDNKPCNYKSYGDYCNPDTCWCAKSMQWKREHGPVSLIDEMKMLQNRANIRTEEYYEKQKKSYELGKQEINPNDFLPDNMKDGQDNH